MAGFPHVRHLPGRVRHPPDRRFHAQADRCPACGPRLRLLDAAGRSVGEDPLAGFAAGLCGADRGAKGVGGYHLACDARSPGGRRRAATPERPRREAVRGHGRRRGRRGRPGRDRRDRARRQLPRPRSSWWIGPGRRRTQWPMRSHRGLPDLEMMLPSTPLHHLLLRRVAGAAGDDQRQRLRRADRLPRRRRARAPGRYRGPAGRPRPPDPHPHRRLGGAVDGARPLMLRRARGYVPASLALPCRRVPVTAYGAELKSTICVGQGRAVPGPLTTSATWRTGRRCARCARRSSTSSACSRSTPEVLAHDLHPEYMSTKETLGPHQGGQSPAVQHHHAHLAACLAEHGRTGTGARA